MTSTDPVRGSPTTSGPPSADSLEIQLSAAGSKTSTSTDRAETVRVAFVGGTGSSFFACSQSKVRVSATSVRRTSQTPGMGSRTTCAAERPPVETCSPRWARVSGRETAIVTARSPQEASNFTAVTPGGTR